MLHTLKTVDDNSLKTNKTKKKSTEKVSRRSDVTEIFDGNVTIYKTTNSGDVYQFQMYVKDEQRYVRKSLKTRDKQVAISLAQKEFIFYQSKILQGEKLFSLTAEEFVEKYLIYINDLVKDEQLSKGRASNIKTFTKHYLEFVGRKTKIQSIDKKYFQEYRSHRQKDKSDITMTVVVNETITIKQLYKWGKDKGYISQNYECDFGRIKVRRDEVRRESFTVKDYKNLVSVAKYWYTKVSENHINRDEEIYYRKSIRDFIVLMGNYGFRTNELRMLKYKDVLVHDDETASVTVREENTKVRKQRVIRGRRGDVFTRRKTYSRYIELEDYIFSHYRKNDVITKELMYDYYNSLIKEVKKKYEDFDESKTLYSLRHFYITIHLLASKVDVYKIARYCGTSMNQIQKHYDNVKDTQISKEMLSYSLKFDKNDEIVLDDDIFLVALVVAVC
jgi:integrase